MGKQEDYDLSQLLHGVRDSGFGTIYLQKLYRLLGKGNRSAGTWRALLDAWEEVGGERRSLQIVELNHGVILLTDRPVSAATTGAWASE